MLSMLDKNFSKQCLAMFLIFPEKKKKKKKKKIEVSCRLKKKKKKLKFHADCLFGRCMTCKTIRVNPYPAE